MRYLLHQPSESCSSSRSASEPGAEFTAGRADTSCVLNPPVPCRRCRCRYREQTTGNPQPTDGEREVKTIPQHLFGDNDNVMTKFGDQTAFISSAVNLSCRFVPSSFSPSSELLSPYAGCSRLCMKRKLSNYFFLVSRTKRRPVFSLWGSSRITNYWDRRCSVFSSIASRSLPFL